MIPADSARIHLLPAKTSPYVLVIRRKPSKLFHIIRWNTRSDTLEHGSWFHGRLYPKRCDISFDGQWMVYLAMGASGVTWNGVCRLPYLRTVAQAPSVGTWYGGGYWRDPKTLMLNGWQPATGSVPFTLERLQSAFGGEDFGVFYPRWERDGWRRRGDNFGTERRIKDAPTFTVVCDGDDGWQYQPSPRHPSLIARFIGYLDHGRTFRYSLEGFEDLLDDRVDSASWDSRGNLVYSREGILYRYSLHEIRKGLPGSVHDLERLAHIEAEQSDEHGAR